MKNLLLLCPLLLIAACGKVNNLGEDKPPIPFEAKSFLVVSHENTVSPIRSKLLNKIVQEKFPSTQKEEQQIPTHDELYNYDLSTKDLSNYESKEKYMAKVIVSFPSREEVYFLPDRVLFSQIVDGLSLTSEGDRKFKWVGADTDKTYSGGVFYLVNLNHEDLINNDKKFFMKEYAFHENFTNNIMKIEKYNEMLIVVDYQFYMQKIVQQSVKYTTKCTRDLIESGECGGCTYSMDTLTNDYERAKELTLNDLGLTVRINGRIYSLADLKAQKVKEGQLEMIVKFSNEIVNNFEVEVIQNPSASYVKLLAGSSYVGFCPSKVAIHSSAQSKTNASIRVRFYGREAELRTIAL